MQTEDTGNDSAAAASGEDDRTSRRRRRRDRLRSGATDMAAPEAEKDAAALPGTTVAPPEVSSSTIAPAIDAAIESIEQDVRILLGLARSVMLPVPSRVDLAERLAEVHLRALRDRVAAAISTPSI